jgi:hypothetical protein
MSLAATPIAPPSARLQVPTIVREELDALRSELDARYAALETALLDPNQTDGLERLVLDLARVATDEAEAAAKRVLLELQMDAETAAASARSDVEELRARLNEAVQAASARAEELTRAQAAVVADAEAAAAVQRELDALRAAHDAVVRERDELRTALEEATSLPDPPAEESIDVSAEAEDEGEENEVLALEIQPEPLLRPATRYTFPRAVDIQIGGDPGTLIELSVHSAQVISPAALKPNHLVRMLVPLGDAAVGYKGRVAWARLEPTRGHQTGLLCRAEIQFTRVEEAAIEAVLIHYAAIPSAD